MRNWRICSPSWGRAWPTARDAPATRCGGGISDSILSRPGNSEFETLGGQELHLHPHLRMVYGPDGPVLEHTADQPHANSLAELTLTSAGGWDDPRDHAAVLAVLTRWLD
ncbi:hypothetical protein GCM10010411_75160 [Actinomadura fulvescens]|uniref:Uncharacterized protein n=1 Tax=Actinomadura fulvescens TaxID=46160 RepID=A0ABN3QIF3_9ACTN